MQDTLDNKVKILVWISFFLIVVHGLNVAVFHGYLTSFGIKPLNVQALPFILIAPFLHASWTHLVQNLFGLVLFGGLSLFRGINFFLKSSVIILLVAGLLVWGFARPTVHVGASGWVFGLWSLTITIALFQRNLSNLAIAVFVLVFYSGMFAGLFPQGPDISHESHLFGAVGGVLSAYLMSRIEPISELEEHQDEPEDDDKPEE